MIIMLILNELMLILPDNLLSQGSGFGADQRDWIRDIIIIINIIVVVCVLIRASANSPTTTLKSFSWRQKKALIMIMIIIKWTLDVVHSLYTLNMDHFIFSSQEEGARWNAFFNSSLSIFCSTYLSDSWRVSLVVEVLRRNTHT